MIEGLMDVTGWIVKICDTAGIKSNVYDDPIEMEGIKRAINR